MRARRLTSGRVGSWLLWVASVLAIGSSAARAESIDGRVRLGLDLVPLEVFTGSISPKNSSEEIELSATNVGLAPTALGLQLGFGASESVIVGARVQVASQSQTVGVPVGGGSVETETTSTTVRFLPYVSYVGGDENDAVRVTISGTVGYASSSSEVGGDGDADSVESTQGGLTIGGTLGMLGFAAAGFSVDPAIFLFHQIGSAKVDGTPSLNYQSTTGGLLVTFSGWLGRGPRARHADDEEDARAWRSSRDRDSTWRPARAAERAVLPTRVPAPPAQPSSPVVWSRVTIDGVLLTLLGQPERRGDHVALRLTRFVGADEAACPQLEVLVDGSVAATLPLASSSEARNGVQELNLQAVTDLAFVDRLQSASKVELRWCNSHRQLTMASAQSVARFAQTMHARLGTAGAAPGTAAVAVPETPAAPEASDAAAPAPSLPAANEAPAPAATPSAPTTLPAPGAQ